MAYHQSRNLDRASYTERESHRRLDIPSKKKYSVEQDMSNKASIVELQRSKSRVKQVEFELAVMKEVADVRTQQLRDSEALAEKLEKELARVKSTTRPPIQTGSETGLRKMLQASQQKVMEHEEEYDVNKDEVIELRSELQKNQNRLHDLEQERNIHLAKVSELLNLLTLHSASEMEKELHVKVLMVAELGSRMEELRKKLEESQDRVEKLEQEREANMAMVVELSQILSPEIDEKKVDEVVANLKAGKKLSTKQAQLLTIQHLKHQVETLEEEKASFLSTIASLKQTEAARKETDPRSSRPSFKFLGGGKN